MTTSHDRPVAAARQADPRQIAEQAAGAPQLGRRRRQDRLGGVHQLLDQRVRPRAEGQPGAPRRAEQVGDQREARAADVREQQRRPAGGDHAAVDLGGFLVGVDGSGDLDQIAVAAQAVEEGAEIGEPSVIVDGPWQPHAACDIMDRGSPPGPTPGIRSSRRGSRRVCGHGAQRRPGRPRRDADRVEHRLAQAVDAEQRARSTVSASAIVQNGASPCCGRQQAERLRVVADFGQHGAIGARRLVAPLGAGEDRGHEDQRRRAGHPRLVRHARRQRRGPTGRAARGRGDARRLRSDRCPAPRPSTRRTAT